MKHKKEVLCTELYTPEGAALIKNPSAIPWSEYPRPHLKRDSYLCLNGAWEFATSPVGAAPQYGETVRVPFVPESPLSGIGRAMPRGERLCYRRRFVLPEGFVHGRVLLHIGAADQIAEVLVNGCSFGTHRGGYASFSFDVTDCLQAENTVEVLVTDELENKILPYGKQCFKRGGMWYTPTSGLWQTVWLESTPTQYVRELHVTTDESGADLTVEMNDRSLCNGEVVLHLPTKDTVFALQNGHARIEVQDPVLWSPDTPVLYDVTVKTESDTVETYFALRTLEVKEVGGYPRLCLNGKPYFFHGLLDQGYFSDGIFLPASPEGYERDILAAKKMGFNMLRKHIKVEPELFYYACDRLGMTVFQDMVNNSDYSFLRDTALPTVGIKRLSDLRMHKNKESREAFLSCMEETVNRLSFHPCVCYWTIFNEGWGQFDHASAYDRLKAIDSTRFVDSVSGWFTPRRADALRSDVESLHIYFKPVRIKPSKKPIVLSEFGGYSYRAEGHVYNLNHNYGYRTFTEQSAFADALEKLYTDEVLPAIGRGLCAAVYTQLSDVEDETNGLLTYDRQVEKVDAERMKRIADALLCAMENVNTVSFM